MGQYSRAGGATAFSPRERLPLAFFLAVRRHGVRFSEHVLHVSIRRQRVIHFATLRHPWFARRANFTPNYYPVGDFLASTSRFGIGQAAGSNHTPLGLHRVAERVGAGWPPGAVFRSRKVIGFTWQGMPEAKITSRILWLEGLETGLNRGGNVDSHARYIYLHGTGDELSLGRPASCGCVHLAARDLLPLFDELTVGTLVWIEP